LKSTTEPLKNPFRPSITVELGWNVVGSDYLRPYRMEKRKKYPGGFTVYVLTHYNDHIRD
jgi:hypothetical protein